jgi:6-phosphofructokinase
MFGEEQLMAIKRIGILTGGGDIPGLNGVIKSATYRRSENDIEILVSVVAGTRSRI